MISESSQLPAISLVVPNYHGSATLTQALESIISQNYPRLELLVVDGGSKDASVEIVKRYARHITWWVSEPDSGQSHAINKGFARATGDIVNWLGSDDLLEPGALRRVGEEFAASPDLDMLMGACRYRRMHPTAAEKDAEIWVPAAQRIPLIECGACFAQPSCFYRRSLLQRAGPLDQSFHYAMDLELWCYLLLQQKAKWKAIPDVLSEFRMTGVNKSSTSPAKFMAECERIYKAYRRERIPLTFWQRHFRYPLERLMVKHRVRLIRGTARAMERCLVAALAGFYGRERVEAISWRWLV